MFTYVMPKRESIRKLNKRKMQLLKIFLMLSLLANTSTAEEISKALSPSFLGSHEIVFSYDGENNDEKSLTAELNLEYGERMALPVRCDPEGGQPALSDSYSLTLPNGHKVLVITCSYGLDHAGLGIKGTQYISYVLKEALSSVESVEKLERLISGYEGAVEEGSAQYYFYHTSEMAKQKLKDGEFDSPNLIRQVMLARLTGRDYEAIRSYASESNIEAVIKKLPRNKSDIFTYNDIGYALAEASEFDIALEVLGNVEKIAPERTVLMLNIADALWGAGRQDEARRYYEKYYSKMKSSAKEKLIPARVTARLWR